MIPRNKLTNEVIITPWVGRGGRGDLYGEPFSRPALVIGENRLVRDASGDEVVASTTVYLNPVEVPSGSLVTVWPGEDIETTATVISVKHYRVRRLSHTVLYLE